MYRKSFKVNSHYVNWPEHNNLIGTKSYASINNHEGDGNY